MSDEKKSSVGATGRQLAQTVSRSIVEDGKPYAEYRQQLRYDFFYSCAYCTITEAEAQAVRLVIDHYEPVIGFPDLENVYKNLMYACEQCNSLKGDRCPPEAGRANGMRFFRIDEEPRSLHFELQDDVLIGLTETGKFTIHACDLNRSSLRRLRRLRRSLVEFEGFASDGIMALASFQIDKLKPEARLKAINSINRMLETANEVFEGLDDLLIEYAKSNILQDEISAEDKQRTKERLTYLKAMEGTIPGNWRGRNAKKKRH